jgi:hypothetical protein
VEEQYIDIHTHDGYVVRAPFASGGQISSKDQLVSSIERGFLLGFDRQNENQRRQGGGGVGDRKRRAAQIEELKHVNKIDEKLTHVRRIDENSEPASPPPDDGNHSENEEPSEKASVESKMNGNTEGRAEAAVEEPSSPPPEEHKSPPVSPASNGSETSKPANEIIVKDNSSPPKVADIESPKVADIESPKEKEALVEEPDKPLVEASAEPPQTPEQSKSPAHDGQLAGQTRHAPAIEEPSEPKSPTPEERSPAETQGDEESESLKHDNLPSLTQASNPPLTRHETLRSYIASVRFLLLEGFGKFQLRLSNPAVAYVKLSRQLEYVLGFKEGEKIQDGSIAKYSFDISGGINHLCIYSSGLMESMIVGNTLSSLLRIVAVGGKGGETVEQIYDSPIYNKVLPKHVTDIDIEIRDLEGRLIPFDHGVVIITLHFKKAIYF